MKKNPIITTLASLFFALVLAIGIDYVYAAWSEPNSNPGSGSIAAPVHVTVGNQVKPGDLSVGLFSAFKNATFKQKTFLTEANVLGNAGTLYVGGTDQKANIEDDLEGNIPSEYTVDTRVNGFVRAGSTLGSEEIITNQNLRLCADDQGHIVFCQKGEFVKTISGTIKGVARYIKITLNEPAPENLSFLVSSYYDHHGEMAEYDQTVLIPKGSTEGKSDSLQNLDVYSCSKPNIAPDIYQMGIPGFLFDLRVDNPC